MNDLQRSILTIAVALVLLVCALILRSTDKHYDKVRVTERELRFEPSRACNKAQQLATRFPERGTGTEGSRAAADWLESEMEALGLQTEQQEFSVWIAGSHVTGQNVIGVDEGDRDETIALIAHYDIPFHVREGAIDDASGVGVVLELARTFSREKQAKTLMFIASDAEEWGMLGARHFADTYHPQDRIRAVVSLDSAPVEHPEGISFNVEGQFRGQTPLWLWMLAEDCVSQVGGEPGSNEALSHFVSQAVNISSTDQGPFVRVGIPAINIGGSNLNSELAPKIYHTTLDTSENLRPALFEIYGNAAELMVRTLDELDYSTDNNQYYLRTGKQTYISRFSLRALQILLFLPLLLATSFQYYSLRTREGLIRQVLAELCNFFLFILPWAFAVGVLYVLVWKNIIPRYELYPATTLDPFLKMPNWKALGAIALTLTVVWAVVLSLRHFSSFLKKPDFACSKAVCLDVLLTVSIVALFLNGFAAILFLAPAALLWGWIESGRSLARLALNILLVSAAAIPFVLLIVQLSERLSLGPYVGWYLILGAGYGLFSPVSILIAFGAGTAGIRLLQQSFTEAAVIADAEMENQ